MMTEDKIERIADRQMDALDRELLSGTITQEEYDDAVKDLNEWVKEEFRLLKEEEEEDEEDYDDGQSMDLM